MFLLFFCSCSFPFVIRSTGTVNARWSVLTVIKTRCRCCCSCCCCCCHYHYWVFFCWWVPFGRWVWIEPQLFSCCIVKCIFHSSRHSHTLARCHHSFTCATAEEWTRAHTVQHAEPTLRTRSTRAHQNIHHELLFNFYAERGRLMTIMQIKKKLDRRIMPDDEDDKQRKHFKKEGETFLRAFSV